ncbi:hypothetical protein E2562_004561 [Oryza meyeriana var. granulata]|uniref:Uncharacterized protein n=1 Tax=Oryza meyeriana var. granulata TaxID=110450 RepID=A0A6G1F3I1_9ORYZ|nr:hypothetical protein E2562_004561 [Oryza meyeriana var. granulata]
MFLLLASPLSWMDRALAQPYNTNFTVPRGLILKPNPTHLKPRRITSLGERDHDRDSDFSLSCAAGFLRIATPPSSSPRLPPAHPAALFLHLAAQPLCAGALFLHLTAPLPPSSVEPDRGHWRRNRGSPARRVAA